MVDFARLREEQWARMTPEQQERVRAREAEEARHEATAADIVATFERLEVKKPAPPPIRRPGTSMFSAPKPRRPQNEGSYETEVTKTWEKTIRVRIEEREGRDGTPGEIIRFIGGTTGYEAYELDERFCAMLVDPEENRARPRFYICAGTAGRYDACRVETADVEAYLRERRPHLFPDAAPRPR